MLNPKKLINQITFIIDGQKEEWLRIMSPEKGMI
jgi:hypothetical protein